MKVDIEQLDKVQKALTIEVDEATFKKALDDTFKEQKGKINIPGFRKGKAPRALIEQYYGKDFFYYDAADKCVYPAYLEALETHPEIQPIADPAVEPVQLEVDKPFIFKAIVDTKQEIALGEYKGLEIEKVETDVTDDMVMEEIERTRQNTALLESVEGEDAVAQNGDTVLIDFVGKKDDVPFAGGTAEGYELVLGSNSFIPGFEDGVVGMKIGEEKALDLTFPTEYHAEDLAGAAVVFDVTLKEIKRKSLAALDDDFAKDVSEFDTLDEYKADIKNDLEQRIQENAENQYKTKLIDAVIEGSDVIAPASLVKVEVDNYVNEMSYTLRSQGVEIEDYLRMTGGNMEDMRKELTPRGEHAVKSSLVLEAIADKEGIEVDDEALEAEYEKLAGLYNMSAEDIKRAFAMQGQGDVIAKNMRIEKAVQLLLDEAKIG